MSFLTSEQLAEVASNPKIMALMVQPDRVLLTFDGRELQVGGLGLVVVEGRDMVALQLEEKETDG